MRTASAVEPSADCRRAPGSVLRRNWQWLIGRTTSSTITTSWVSTTSASSVASTEPSSAFSIGTTARCTLPSATAATVAWIVAKGTGSTPSGALASSASSVNVPGGPK
jgi:hypothetical protein